MRTTILTAIYDNYDSLKPVLEQSIDVDWICVTDEPSTWEPGWKIIVEPRVHIHPNRAAKLPKCLPWLYANTDTSIWIDASYRVTSNRFAEEILQYAQPLAQFKHPWRSCLYKEIEESLMIPKYEDCRNELMDQITIAKACAHQSNWGLWATGVIARRHTPSVIGMGHDWLKAIYQYSYQDQVSHPLVCNINGLRPIDLPGTHLSNEWLLYEGSGRH